MVVNEFPLIIVEVGLFYLEVFAKTFKKVLYFLHKYFTKIKRDFREKLSLKTKAKNHNTPFSFSQN
jgi:hypothetical protein